MIRRIVKEETIKNERKKAIICTAVCENPEDVKLGDYDFCVAADGGLEIAKSLGLKVDLCIGDMDSLGHMPDMEYVKLPCEKDMTDTESAVDYCVDKGYRDITILGGLGKRFDHTMANLAVLGKYCNMYYGNVSIRLIDGLNYVEMKMPGEYEIDRSEFDLAGYHYLGLVSYDLVSGLSLDGTKYIVKNYSLDKETSQGISNEIVGDCAKITFEEGRLLFIFSKK
ncbi:MAG: thiamine diphosphokinase [Clostridia bacterium]|nr:thiamine diphosphokinase [Clostridia bacterium]